MDDVLDTIQLLEEMDDILFSMEENEETENGQNNERSEGDTNGQ